MELRLSTIQNMLPVIFSGPRRKETILPSQRKRPENPEIGRVEWLVPALRFLALIVLFVAVADFLFNLWNIRAIPSLSTDGLIYHLTIPAFWRQEGFLHTVDLPFHDGAAEHSPLFSETLIYLLMSLTGDDGLAWLVQPAFFLLLAWAFYRSARLMEVEINTARFLTTLLILFPPFFRSAQIINSEMVLTSGTAFFCFGMLLTRTHRERGCWIAALGIALTLAAKTIGIIYGSLALLILIGWILFAVRTQANTDEPWRWRMTAIVCALIILAGSAFYLRNLWQFGNPLYPAEFFVFPGRYDTSVFVKHGWSPAAFSKMLLNDTETFAMKTQFAAVLWLGMLVNLVYLVLRRIRKSDILPTVLFVGYPLASIVLYFVVTPFWREHRLLFPVYYLLWGGLAWTLFLLMRDRKEEQANWIAAAVGFAGLAYTLAFVFFDEVPLWFVGIAAALGLVLGNYPEQLEKRGRLLWLIPVVIIASAAISGPSWYADYAKQRLAVRAQYYSQAYNVQGDAWNEIDKLTAKRSATVAYSGNAMIFPLFGVNLANRVVYLPLSDEDRPQQIELSGNESIYLQLARQRRATVDEAFWIKQLREQQVDFLYLVDEPAFGGVQAELSMAAANPQLLQPIFQQENVSVYKVNRGE